MIERVSREGALPLSYNQDLQMVLDWAAICRGEPRTAMPVTMAAPVGARPDVAALEGTLNELVRRHEVLRTTFTEPTAVSSSDSERLWQRIEERDYSASSLFEQQIHDAARVELRVTRQGADFDDDQDLQRLLKTTVSERFDYRIPPLLRAVLIERTGADGLLLIVLDHLVCDRWSLARLRREFRQIHQALSSGQSVAASGEPAAVHYVDFAVWQRRQVLEGRFAAMIAYWADRWAEYASERLVAEHFPFVRPPAQNGAAPNGPSAFSVERLPLPSALCVTLRQFARSTRSTLYALWLTAVTLVFHLYTRRSKIALLGNLANRMRPEVEPMIGWIANAYLFGVTVTPGGSAAELLRRVREAMLDAQANQELPQGALFASMLGQERMPTLGAGHPIGIDFTSAAEAQPVPLVEHAGAASVALPVHQAYNACRVGLSETANGMTLNAIYAVDRFGADDIAQMLRDFAAVLTRLATSPDDKVDDFATSIRPHAADAADAPDASRAAAAPASD